ncbi:MAG TPA: hypothetical protein VKB59_00055 [Micromonosporaceae bacterium]|nr:hypothetical protein [Micromonosporaceae bacterium]
MGRAVGRVAVGIVLVVDAAGTCDVPLAPADLPTTTRLGITVVTTASCVDAAPNFAVEALLVDPVVGDPVVGDPVVVDPVVVDPVVVDPVPVDAVPVDAALPIGSVFAPDAGLDSDADSAIGSAVDLAGDSAVACGSVPPAAASSRCVAPAGSTAAPPSVAAVSAAGCSGTDISGSDISRSDISGSDIAAPRHRDTSG